jgi:hypothetical protein
MISNVNLLMVVARAADVGLQQSRVVRGLWRRRSVEPMLRIEATGA